MLELAAKSRVNDDAMHSNQIAELLEFRPKDSNSVEDLKEF